MGINESSTALHPKLTKKLSHFEFAGKVLAKCLYDTIIYDPCLVNVHFSRAFYKQLLGLPIHYSDLKYDDPQFYNSTVKYILENNELEELELYFTANGVEETSNGNEYREINLKPNGDSIQVTNENKLEYLLLFTEFKLSLQVQKQIHAFAKGFYSIIKEDSLNFFDEQELELLTCGLPHIPIHEMQKYTNIKGYSDTDDIINWFWTAIQNFTEEEKAKMLQFITGSSQVPLEGFGAFIPPITIGKSIMPEGSLPTAHTCFNVIDLPSYRTYEDLATKILLAFTEGSEGFAFS